MKKENYSKVITANRLFDGAVVFLTSDNIWVENIGRAKILAASQSGDVAYSVSTEVIDFYEIDVQDLPDGRVQPVKFREQLRAFGPSSHTQFKRCLGGFDLSSSTARFAA